MVCGIWYTEYGIRHTAYGTATNGIFTDLLFDEKHVNRGGHRQLSSGQEPQQGGLSPTVRPQQTVTLPRCQTKVGVPQ